ncbi:hypothetical protein CPB85DRAFT_1458074 [Mucidula mucida]|nr:hypothetical protein CPB85DRAFT_1458074 [Mucidula mucida]
MWITLYFLRKTTFDGRGMKVREPDLGSLARLRWRVRRPEGKWNNCMRDGGCDEMAHRRRSVVQFTEGTEYTVGDDYLVENRGSNKDKAYPLEIEATTCPLLQFMRRPRHLSEVLELLRHTLRSLKIAKSFSSWAFFVEGRPRLVLAHLRVAMPSFRKNSPYG